MHSWLCVMIFQVYFLCAYATACGGSAKEKTTMDPRRRKSLKSVQIMNIGLAIGAYAIPVVQVH